MIDIRFHHVVVAFFIAVLCHALAIYSISMMKNTQEPLTLPRVIEAMLISAPQPQVAEQPQSTEQVAVKPAVIHENSAPQVKPKTIEPENVQPEPENAITTETAQTENPESNNDVSSTESMTPANTSATVAEPVFTPPKVDAKSKDNPPPAYPRIARRLGQEGTVVLDVFILADGSVGDVKLKTTSGHSRLDDSAVEAVRHWRYIPARLGDKAVSHWYTQSVKFVLN